MSVRPSRYRGDTGLGRNAPLRRTKGLKRSGRLAGQSPKRRSERAAREAVRAEVRRRAGGRCEAHDLVPEVSCAGPYDVDEIEARGVNPGGHLDVDNCQLLCRAHHDWKHAHPLEAEALGLRRRSTYEGGSD